VVECAGLEIRYTVIPYRGFESHPLRQDIMKTGLSARFSFLPAKEPANHRSGFSVRHQCLWCVRSTKCVSSHLADRPWLLFPRRCAASHSAVPTTTITTAPIKYAINDWFTAPSINSWRRLHCR
jgi:hypothetical protein